MSTKPRTPEHFPRMKHRAAKRRVLYVDILPNLDAFQAAVVAASGGFSAMADRFAAITEVLRQIFGNPGKQSDYVLSPPPLTPPHPTTEAAPNRAASHIPGRKR